MSPQEMKQAKLANIYHALLASLATHTMNEISISSLCQQAHVSRTYFYREFGNFSAIIKKYQTQQTLQYLRSLSNNSNPDFETMMTRYFELIQSGANDQQLLLRAGFYTTLVDTFAMVFSMLVENNLVPGERRIVTAPYYVAYLSGAVVNMSVAWLTAGMPNTPAEMGKRVVQFATR